MIDLDKLEREAASARQRGVCDNSNPPTCRVCDDMEYSGATTLALVRVVRAALAYDGVDLGDPVAYREALSEWESSLIPFRGPPVGA